MKPLPHARIPIVKLSLDPSPGLPYGIACDIGFENRLALENTRLLMCYALIDPPRVRTMVLFRECAIVSSFSIHYFECPLQSKSGVNDGKRSDIRITFQMQQSNPMLVEDYFGYTGMADPECVAPLVMSELCNAGGCTYVVQPCDIHL